MTLNQAKTVNGTKTFTPELFVNVPVANDAKFALAA